MFEVVDSETSLVEQLAYTGRLGEGWFAFLPFWEADHRRIPAQEDVRVVGIEGRPEQVFNVSGPNQVLKVSLVF
jgi:hypothetical protein